jgi:hypothetical protein
LLYDPLTQCVALTSLFGAPKQNPFTAHALAAHRMVSHVLVQ